MKKYFFLSVFVLLFFQGYSQESNQVFSRERTVTRISTRTIDVDLNKVYNKNTGEKMIPEKVEQLIRNNSKIRLEPYYGNDGKVSRFYYFPEAASGKKIAATEIIEAGKPFLEFKMKTTEGKMVWLKDLKGKLVVLHFTLDAMYFRYDELENLDKKINTLYRKEDVEALVLVESSATSLAPKFDLKISNFELVNEALGFVRKFGLRRLPSTVVIDAEGKLLGIFKRVEDIDLNSYL